MVAKQHYPTFEFTAGGTSGGAITETLAVNKLLLPTSEKYQFLEPTVPGIIVTMPTVPFNGLEFVIRNDSTVEDLQINEMATPIHILLPGQQVLFVWGGAVWEAV